MSDPKATMNKLLTALACLLFSGALLFIQAFIEIAVLLHIRRAPAVIPVEAA